jgi:hypothetical protein
MLRWCGMKGVSQVERLLVNYIYTDSISICGKFAEYDASFQQFANCFEITTKIDQCCTLPFRIVVRCRGLRIVLPQLSRKSAACCPPWQLGKPSPQSPGTYHLFGSIGWPDIHSQNHDMKLAYDIIAIQPEKKRDSSDCLCSAWFVAPVNPTLDLIRAN